MGTIITVLIVLIVLFIIFIIAPSVVGCVCAFGRKNGREVSRESLKGTFYEAKADEVLDSIEFLKKQNPKQVKTVALDDTELVGDLYEGGDRGLVIMFHGYNVAPFLNYAVIGRMFLEEGYSILLTDQRGHGRSGGNQTTMGIREKADVYAWVDMAHREKLADRIILYGISMGATTIGMAAGELSGDVSAMVYDSGYLSPYDEMSKELSKRYLPAFLMMPFIRLTAKLLYQVDIKDSVRRSLARCDIPTAFVHCQIDPTVPFSQGMKAYDACAAEKIFLESPATGHTVALLYNYSNERKKILDFIGKH